jgi:hypothetical protein
MCVFNWYRKQAASAYRYTVELRHTPEADWVGYAPWRRWGMPGTAPDDCAFRTAYNLAGRLGMDDETDLLLVGEDSITLLWRLWRQPFYINIIRVGSHTIVRAGCAPLSFIDEVVARSFAYEHNGTTTLWSWYSEKHPEIAGAGVWLSFIKLVVADSSATYDLEFAAAVLRDMAADSFLKFGNNTTELEAAGEDAAIAEPPSCGVAGDPYDGPIITQGRYDFAAGFRGLVYEHPDKHGNAYDGALGEKVGFLVAMELRGGHIATPARTGNELLVAFREPVSFWADASPLVLFRTDVENPAMGPGLLAHVVTDIEFSVQNAEAANAHERRSVQPVHFLGAWTVDPLQLRSSGEGSSMMAHTAFYPSYYFKYRPAFAIAARLNSRIHSGTEGSGPR